MTRNVSVEGVRDKRQGYRTSSRKVVKHHVHDGRKDHGDGER